MEREKAKKLISILEKDLILRNQLISQSNSKMNEELNKFNQIHIFSLQMFLNGEIVEKEFDKTISMVEEHIKTISELI